MHCVESLMVNSKSQYEYTHITYRGGFTMSFRAPHLHGPLPRSWWGGNKYSLSCLIL